MGYCEDKCVHVLKCLRTVTGTQHYINVDSCYFYYLFSILTFHLDCENHEVWDVVCLSVFSTEYSDIKCLIHSHFMYEWISSGSMITKHSKTLKSKGRIVLFVIM